MSPDSGDEVVAIALVGDEVNGDPDRDAEGDQEGAPGGQ